MSYTRKRDDKVKPIYKKAVFWKAFLPYIAFLTCFFMVFIVDLFMYNIAFIVALYIKVFYPIIAITWSLIYLICKIVQRRLRFVDVIPLVISTISLIPLLYYFTYN